MASGTGTDEVWALGGGLRGKRVLYWIYYFLFDAFGVEKSERIDLLCSRIRPAVLI